MLIKNINFGYEHLLFKDAEIKIPNSGFVAITGESGCGKSTLLKIIYRQIELNDLVIDDEILYRDMIYFDQYATLDNDQSIEKAYHFYCEIYNRSYNIEKLKSSLKKVNLKVEISKLIRDLSSGQRKRLAIAIAIYINPKLIIFDEPTSSLDYENKIQIIEFLKDLSKNTVVLISSHDNDIEKYYDMIYKISNKKIILINKQLNEELEDRKDNKNIYKINYRKLKKYQGKKAKRFILLLIIILFVILHIASFEQILLYYQGKNTEIITNAISKNMIYFTYENVNRNQLPIDYDYISYIETDAIIDLDTNNKIKELENVDGIYPYYQLESTGYFSRIDDIDCTTSQVSVKTNTVTKTIVLDGSEDVTPAIVPYYDEDNSLKQRDGNFIDDITAQKLGISETDLPVTISIEVGIPVCCTYRNDSVTYYENNEPMDKSYNIEVNQVIYDKKTITIDVDEIISSEGYYNYYDSNGGGGFIYVKYDVLENIIKETATTDLENRIQLYDDLNEKIINLVPSNYIVFINSVDYIKEVNNQILSLNNRIMTYAPSTTIDETIKLRKNDKQNRYLINIIYIIIGLIITTILLYRFNKSYINKIDFYHNVGLKEKQIILYIQRNVLNICLIFFVANVLFSTVRAIVNEELYIINKGMLFIIFLIFSTILSLIIYGYNYCLLKRLIHDKT